MKVSLKSWTDSILLPAFNREGLPVSFNILGTKGLTLVLPTLLHSLPILLNSDLFQLMTIFEYIALTVVFSHFLNRVLRMAGAKTRTRTM